MNGRHSYLVLLAEAWRIDREADATGDLFADDNASEGLDNDVPADSCDDDGEDGHCD